MQRSGRAVAFAVLLLLPAVAWCAPQVMFLESQDQGFIGKQQDSRIALNGEGLGASLAALLSSQPTFAVSPLTSRQVQTTVAGDVFHRPDAVVALQIAGLELGESVRSTLGALGHSAAYGLNELAQVAINAVAAVARGGSVQHVPLDHRAVTDCDDDCAEALIKEAAPSWGATYTRAEGQDPAAGELELALPAADGSSSGSVKLDLGELSARLWAVELANMGHTAAKHAADMSSKKDGASSTQQPALLESTLLGLQGMASKYQPSSEQFKGAAAATVKAVSSAVTSLRGAYGERLVLQLSTLGEVPLDKLSELMNWRNAHERRVLLGRQLEQGDDRSDMTVQEWSTWAAQILVSLVLLWAMVGSVYVMVFMKYKQDTLLYTKPKAE